MIVIKRFLELLLDIIAFGAIAFAVLWILFQFTDNLYNYIQVDEDGAIASHPLAWLLDYTPYAIGALVATLITHVFIFKRPFHTTGLGRNNLLVDYGKGFIIGVVLISIGFIALRILGYYDILNYNDGIQTIFLFLIFFIVQSFFEEVAFRSYLMPAIESRFGLWTALILSSALFTFIHLDNSNINPVGTINIFVASLLLGALFIKYNNAWAASGMHCAWNYFQSSIYGFEVSGEKMYSWMVTEEVGPDILTGGLFGFEGSILSFLILGGLFLYYILRDENVINRLKMSPLDLESKDTDTHNDT